MAECSKTSSERAQTKIPLVSNGTVLNFLRGKKVKVQLAHILQNSIPAKLCE